MFVPADLMHGPNPRITVRTATLPIDANNTMFSETNATHVTSELLGIPPSSLFARPKSQGEISILSRVWLDRILPTTIVAHLHRRFHGLDDTPVKHDKIIHSFVWYLDDSYDRLLAEKPIAAPEKHELYLRHASCCVRDAQRVKPDSDIDYSNIYDDDAKTLHDYAIQHIGYFIAKNPFCPFELHIYWDYSSVQLKPADPSSEGMLTSLADTIQSEIQRKMKATLNFEDQTYIARRDLDPFLDFDVVDRVIREDTSLSVAPLCLDDNQKRDFARQLQTLPAVILFAMCVHVGLEMRILYHFVNHHNPGFNDMKLPTGKCHWGACRDKGEKITKAKPAFFPQKIEKDRRFHKLEKTDVMPLYHGGPKNTKKVLGKGAFATVYEVGIDPAHTYLSGVGSSLLTFEVESKLTSLVAQDPESRFALKEFSGQQSQEAFGRERKMLETLADYDDKHIVTPHTFWTQGEKCFILYPKADTSLREFTKLWEPPNSIKPVNVYWFLIQLKGLADAIDHVHSLKKIPTTSNPNPEEIIQWGSHLDIKPENILVFGIGSIPTFKIADFGAGNFNPVTKDGISRGYSNNPGTPTYWAPDHETKGKVSRPADMWSLGCVFLELLLWYFKFFTAESVVHFTTRRADFSGMDPNFKTDLFWCKQELKSQREPIYVHRPAVKSALDDLTKICQDMRAFREVVEMIRHLLTIDMEERWTAQRLATALGKLMRQALKDLHDQPDFYTRKYYENTGGSVQDVKLQEEAIEPLLSRAASKRTTSPSVHSQGNRHQHSDSVDSSGRGGRGVPGTPTSPMVVAAGTADALSKVQSEPLDGDFWSPDEPKGASAPPRPRSPYLQIPRFRSRSMGENPF
jgi:serine/threonine protein kinase